MQPIQHRKPYALLSIDLGVDNLGYAVLSYDKPIISGFTPKNKPIYNKLAFEDIHLEYGLFDIDAHANRVRVRSDTSAIKKTKDVVLGRCVAMQTFFNGIALNHVSIDYVIIERQVTTNVCAMELMYAATSQALNHTDNVIIFDPKLKFTKLNVEYDTKNKAHKRLSASFAKQLLTNKYPDKIGLLDESKKKDDMSDAINQAFVWLLDNGILNCDKDTYRQLIGV